MPNQKTRQGKHTDVILRSIKYLISVPHVAPHKASMKLLMNKDSPTRKEALSPNKIRRIGRLTTMMVTDYVIGCSNRLKDSPSRTYPRTLKSYTILFAQIWSILQRKRNVNSVLNLKLQESNNQIEKYITHSCNNSLFNQIKRAM